MFSLRSYLILSHSLPTLISVLLIGLTLIYVLETQVLLVNLSQQLTRQAALLATIAADYPEIWQEQPDARQFAARFAPALTAQFMLLTPTGVLLVSTDQADKPLEGTTLTLPELATLQPDQAIVQTNYSPNLQAEVIDVFMPVLGQHRRLVGVVRLTHVYATVYERFWRLRYLVLEVLAAGLLIGVVTGAPLALSLARPLVRLTNAIQRFVQGEEKVTLTEEGVTEIRRLIRAFNLLADQLLRQEATRRRLLANLIHEVRRPLGALSSATHALLHGASDDHALRTELLTGMETEFHHLQHLMTDLLLVYEQALGNIELDRQPTDLEEWLTTSLAHWRAAARQKGLAWRVAIPEQLPTLFIDPVRLGQALGNLISNAIKFTPVPGAVSIEAGVTQDSIWIAVADTGPGIDPQEHQQIFEPFYRGRTRHRFPEGMGLGLTIARDLVNAHGGRLAVASAPDAGSHFTLTLPLYNAVATTAD